MGLLNLRPIHIATGFSILQPRQTRVGLHHRIDGLRNRVLVDLFDIDVQAVDRIDDGLTVRNQLTLFQRLIGGALPLGRLPSQVTAALLVAFLVQVLHRLESDAPTAIEGQVFASVELGPLITLVATAEQRQVTPGFDFAADVFHIGDFIVPGFLGAERALFLHVVQRIVAVLCRQRLKIAAGDDLAGDGGDVAAGAQAQVAAGVDAAAVLGDGFAVVVAASAGAFDRFSRDEVDVATGIEGNVDTAVQDATDVVDVAAGADAEVVGRFDASGVIDHITLLAVAPGAAVVGTDGAFSLSTSPLIAVRLTSRPAMMPPAWLVRLLPANRSRRSPAWIRPLLTRLLPAMAARLALARRVPALLRS